VEAARALGLRLARDSRYDRDQRVTDAFRRCLGRTPTAHESAIVAQVYEEHRTLYAAEPESAAQLLGDESPPPEVAPPEAAAWVAVARTLLNLDEFITRE
jgi:hypothetical protein